MKKVKCPYCGKKNTERVKIKKRVYILLWFLAVFALICLVGFIDAGWWIAAIIDLVLIIGGFKYFDQKRKYYKCNDCEKVFDK